VSQATLAAKDAASLFVLDFKRKFAEAHAAISVKALRTLTSREWSIDTEKALRKDDEIMPRQSKSFLELAKAIKDFKAGNTKVAKAVMQPSAPVAEGTMSMDAALEILYTHVQQAESENVGVVVLKAGDFPDSSLPEGRAVYKLVGIEGLKHTSFEALAAHQSSI
jgi:hypothetical protein